MKATDGLNASAAAQAAALSPSSYHDFAGLASLKGKAGRAGGGETALRATAQQFEAMFLQEMMRTMRQATIKSDLLESSAMETYEGLFDKEVAMQMAKRGGMGLAEVMVKQMKRHVEGAEASAAAAAASTANSPTAATPVSTQDALRQRELAASPASAASAAFPLQRPARAHELNPATERAGLPLRQGQAYGLPGRTAPPSDSAASPTPSTAPMAAER